MHRRLLLVVALLCLGGCSTIAYRGVQSDFNDAVAADNASIENPLFTPTAGYSEILDRLTPEYIGKLDPKLQPNAWMLRAISAWRTGDLATAKASADAGLGSSPPDNSRDKIVLMAVYGLIADTEVMDAWQATASEQRNKGLYDQHKDKFATAWRKLAEAEAEIGPATPRSVESYVHYQKWRVAANWAGVISGCDRCSADDRNEMRERAASDVLGGKRPQAAADAERDQVNGQLRELIRAQGGG